MPRKIECLCCPKIFKTNKERFKYCSNECKYIGKLILLIFNNNFHYNKQIKINKYKETQKIKEETLYLIYELFCINYICTYCNEEPLNIGSDWKLKYTCGNEKCRKRHKQEWTKKKYYKKCNNKNCKNKTTSYFCKKCNEKHHIYDIPIKDIENNFEFYSKKVFYSHLNKNKIIKIIKPKNNKINIESYTQYDKNNYTRFKIGNKYISDYKIAWILIYGKYPNRNKIIHHIDHNKSNCDSKNLKEVTPSENVIAWKNFYKKYPNAFGRIHRKKINCLYCNELYIPQSSRQTKTCGSKLCKSLNKEVWHDKKNRQQNIKKTNKKIQNLPKQRFCCICYTFFKFKNHRGYKGIGIDVQQYLNKQTCGHHFCYYMLKKIMT